MWIISVPCSSHNGKKASIQAVLMAMTGRFGYDTRPGARLPGHTHLGRIQDPERRAFRQDSSRAPHGTLFAHLGSSGTEWEEQAASQGGSGGGRSPGECRRHGHRHPFHHVLGATPPPRAPAWRQQRLCIRWWQWQTAHTAVLSQSPVCLVLMSSP